MDFDIYNSINQTSALEKEEIVSFLHQHLDEFGDTKEDIGKAIAFALKEKPTHGGFVLVGKENDETQGIVVINRTGMEGYIPENILVYIAVRKDARGKGIGKQLMNKALELADGDIALHVEPHNPARYLYEKLGFENKYLEMRLKK
jgi:GNAT superfamily N-acetyltransferase